MSSNLPPGVTESMIPGNRPEDVMFEKWLDSEIGDLLYKCAQVQLHAKRNVEREIVEALKNIEGKR